MASERKVRFGEFELNESAGELFRRGAPVKLHPKPLAVLLHLIRNRERVVSKDELLAAVWPDVSVSALALWSAVRDLRRALGDTDTAERIIETVRGRGVRFVARVGSSAAAAASETAAATHAEQAWPPASGILRLAADGCFVDREDAMVVLRASLAAAKRGEMRASFIAGAAGMGKTRLTAELSRAARELGFEVQVGRCFDREDATSFWPWLQVLRGLLSSERSAAEAQRMHAALPELAFIAPDRVLAGERPEHPAGRRCIAA
jgi:DNA-binding winged helix-turn-helix (wHTH) protein